MFTAYALKIYIIIEYQLNKTKEDKVLILKGHIFFSVPISSQYHPARIFILIHLLYDQKIGNKTVCVRSYDSFLCVCKAFYMAESNYIPVI